MAQGLFRNTGASGRPAADTPSTNGQPDRPSSGATILLIDDDPAVSRALEIAFRMAGHRLDFASGPEEAFSRLARHRYDAILLDMNFGAGRSDGEQGLACLARILSDDPAACVVVLTAHSGLRIAVAAMQAGARDFVTKPWRNAELVGKVESAVTRGTSLSTRSTLPAADEIPPRLLGESAAIQELRDLIRRVAPTSAGVAVTGRSGTGRTLAAMAIHAASREASTAPVRVDLRDPTAWSLLAGASGTVLLRHPDRLDEIAQARLLDHLPPHLRCIAISDTLDALIPALQRRIATVEVPVPPLSRRGEDAVLLARHFAQMAAERFGRHPVQLTAAAEAAIRATRWPDEVRGLALAIERAVLLADGGLIDAATLGPPLPVPDPASHTVEKGFDLSEAEKAVVAAALREHRHNVTRAAAALGLSRGALYRRMARYGL
jgi:DNA-binding NtrC family response regulator